MTVAALPATIDYFENGSTLAFAAPFRFKSSADLVVTRYFADGTKVTLVLGVDYTATGGSTDAGGTVTMTVAAVTGTRLRIKRVTARAQASTYTTGDRFPAELTEQTFDKAMLIDQEQDVAIADLQARALQFPVGSVVPEMPPLANGEGRVLGIADGQFVFVANNAVAVAGDVAAAQAAAAAAAASAGQTAGDVVTTTAALALLPTRYSKTLDTTITASTVLAADPDLHFPIAANALVTVKGKIFFTTTAAGDFKWRHTGPAAPTRVRVKRQTVAPGDTAETGILVDNAFSASDITVLGGAGQGIIEIDCLIKNGSNAGNFGISWAQNTSDAGNTIVEAGSYLEAAVLAVPLGFVFADAAIAKLGEWPLTLYGGRNAALCGGDVGQAWVEFIVSGFKLTAVMYGNGSNCRIIIDGGAPQVITPPAGWSTVTLFSGLTDAPHRVKLGGASGTSLACAFDVVGTFSLESHAVPAVTHPTDISNYWPLGIAPYAVYGALDTTPGFGGGFGYYSHPYTWGGDGFGMRFRSTTDKVQVFSYGYGGGQFVLLRDGVQVGGPFVMPADGVWDIRTLATGLTGTHEYEIIQIVADHISTDFAVLAANIEPVAHPVRDLDVWYGDSIVVESVLTDVRQGEAWIVATAGGRAAHRIGTGGAKASTFGRDNTALVTGLAQAPVKIFECFGANDMQLGVSLATFQADVQTMLQNLRAGCPSAKIYCRGILPVASSISNYTQRSAYNAAKAAAVAAIGDPLIVYVNTDGWLNTTTGLYDGLHPNAAGYGTAASAQLLVM